MWYFLPVIYNSEKNRDQPSEVFQYEIAGSAKTTKMLFEFPAQVKKKFLKKIERNQSVCLASTTKTCILITLYLRYY